MTVNWRARAYLAGESAFPERVALNQLLRFLTDFYVMVARWIEWASGTVDTWPDQVTDAAFDVVAAQESVELAEQVDAILRR